MACSCVLGYWVQASKQGSLCSRSEQRSEASSGHEGLEVVATHGCRVQVSEQEPACTVIVFTKPVMSFSRHGNQVVSWCGYQSMVIVALGPGVLDGWGKRGGAMSRANALMLGAGVGEAGKPFGRPESGAGVKAWWWTCGARVLDASIRAGWLEV